MVLRTSALWACLLIASVSNADRTYIVKRGDTLGSIARKAGVSEVALRKANPKAKPTALQLGAKLSIPGKSAGTTAKASSSIRTSGYTVRNGDHDWLIARKLGMTVGQLHSLNPGVSWRNLQPGQTLRVKAGAVASSSKPVTTAKSSSSSTAYKARQGDNDWVLAKRFSTTPTAIRKLNPGVNWERLQIGQSLRVPAPAKQPVKSPSFASRGAKVAVSTVVMRSRPSSKSSRIGTAKKGEIAKVLDRESGWVKVRFGSGAQGWVRQDTVSQTNSVPKATKQPVTTAKRENPSKKHSAPKIASSGVAVLDQAQRYLGVRYRYGGTSRAGFDCSGFVGYVYRSVGVKLPRTSSEQSRVGTYVSKSNLSPGDLVFFKTNRGTRINHVGIYIGDSKFIHASSGRGHVRIDTLSGGYYDRRFATARRVSSKAGRKAVEAVTKVDPPQVKTADSDPVEDPKPAKGTVGTDEIGR